MVDRVYFRDPTKEEEKEIIGLADKRFRSSCRGSILMLVIGLLMLLSSAGFFIFRSSDRGAAFGLLFLAAIFLIFGSVNMRSSKSIVKEFREGHFLVQDIEVADMLFQDPRCQDTYALALRTKEGHSFDLPASADRYKEFSIGMKGLLAVMYGEEGLFKAGRDYFVPEEKSVKLSEEAFESSFAADGESSELPSPVLSSLPKRHLPIPLILVICELPYLIGALIAFSAFRNSTNPEAWTIPLDIAGLISTFFLILGCKNSILLDFYLKKGKRSYVLVILWICLPFVAISVYSFERLGAPGIFILLSHIIWFIVLGVLVFICSYKRRNISRALKNGTAKWAKGTIIQADKRFYAISRYGSTVPFITVRLNNGGTVFFNVYNENNARDLRIGVTGYVIQINDTFCGQTVPHYYFAMDPEKDGSD